MTAEDRIAIILGRAIIRAEALQAENDQLRNQLAASEPDPDCDRDEEQ